MSRRIPCRIGVLCLVFGLAGCDYGSSSPPPAPGGAFQGGAEPLRVGSRAQSAVTESKVAGVGQRNKVILDSLITMMENAVIKPGGQNFELATRDLNNYFVNPDPADYALSDDARTFLAGELPEPMLKLKKRSREEQVKDFERTRFQLVDARHLEDCMLYSRIARRVAGSGDDLTRVNRLFDWTVRQVLLVPPRSLAGRAGFQAQARPFDVLIRGMATEDGAGWAERAWVFLSLCRQLDLDCAMLAYTPTGAAKQATAANDAKDAGTPSDAHDASTSKPGRPVPWVCAVLIDGKAYLFDARIGLPVPGPDGSGVATLEQALDNPRVLDRLELPGQSVYGTTRAQLLASPSKISVLLDSTPGYFSPRMRLLQDELKGKDRTVLYRDPIAQSRKFAEAIGPRFGSAGLWELPIMVNTLLFASGPFTEASRESVALFDPNLPLIYARIRELRGETSEAISKYVDMRFAERPMMMDKKNKMPAELQRAMDVYSTYFLGLCHLEQNNSEQAEFFFRETLKMLPEPGPGRLYYNMFRWGAQTNLGRVIEERGDSVVATAYYTQPDPTPQHHGNLLRARALVWLDPTAPPPPALPPAPAVPTRNILLRDPAQ